MYKLILFRAYFNNLGLFKFHLKEMLKRKYKIEFGQAKDHSIDYLVGILKDARLTTIQMITKVENSAIDWQFKKGWNTIGALLSHISAIEHYFRIEFIEGRNLTKEENDKWLPAMDMGPYISELLKGLAIEDYIAELENSRAMLIGALQHISFDDFTKRINEYDDVDGSNLAWALFHMVEDEIYHRGQISILQKLFIENAHP
jgi:uncharacterized damage-inducible protein DinB